MGENNEKMFADKGYMVIQMSSHRQRKGDIHFQMKQTLDQPKKSKKTNQFHITEF